MKRALFFLKIIIYVLWPATVWASGLALNDAMKSVPMFAWLTVFIISMLAGLAALLNRLRDEMPQRLGLFIGAHMVSSLLAGVLTFFIGERAALDGMTEAISVALAAYAGAAALDKMAAKFIDKTGT